MLPSKNRLTKKTDFERVRQNGQFLSTPLFSLSSYDRKDKEESRFGFIVSKKISMRSHTRNRVKRILREIIQKNLNITKEGRDFVLVAKPGIVHAGHDTIETEILKCLKTLQ